MPRSVGDRLRAQPLRFCHGEEPRQRLSPIAVRITTSIAITASTGGWHPRSGKLSNEDREHEHHFAFSSQGRVALLGNTSGQQLAPRTTNRAADNSPGALSPAYTRSGRARRYSFQELFVRTLELTVA
jgi:hypothetical protein